jgi:Fic family protein
MFVTPAPSIRELMEKLGEQQAVGALMAPREVLARDRYLHWDKLRHLDSPAGLSSEQWWLKTRLARSDELRRLPLTDPGGNAFGYTLPDIVLRHLHHIDQRCGGEVAMDEVVTFEGEAGKRFLVNSLMEEAIRSSQLEGATTSRVIAKELLRSGRAPKDRSERMIANNYRALQFMRAEMDGGLTPDSILELHRIVTEGTLDEPAAAGRLQRPGEARVSVFEGEKRVHVPPPARELPGRMQLLCEFANEGDEGEPFVHPVVRAILLHFWLAYDHPFADGNGRTARILFFWAMHRAGYWLAEYLPISRLIRSAPARYGRAFLETETDGGDTTYFLLHQLGLIERSIEDLHLYLQRKIAEQHDVERTLHAVEGINGRQLVLLTHAVKHPDHIYTFGGHAHSHRVTHETARADLGGLTERGLLRRRRRGRAYRFEPAPDLPQRLRDLGA